MPQGTCSIDGCEREAKTRGWCQKHYWRWWKHGDPNWHPPTLTDRFWRSVDVRGPDECWPWTGRLSVDGYGEFTHQPGGNGAHRFAYRSVVGPIPPGLTIDHACHNRDLSCNAGSACPHRRCCNPAHLEAVTRRANILNGRTLAAANAAKTHCPRGHPYSGDNLRVSKGKRYCIACERLS